MRRSGFLPPNLGAIQPLSYRLWRSCEDHGTLWWDGGIARQPHLLMLEFQCCRMAQASFMQWMGDIEAAVVAAEKHLRSLTSGHQHLRLGK